MEEHHLFELIGGNPLSILLIAPMLNDPHKKMTLTDLYTMLTKQDELVHDDDKASDSSLLMRVSIESAFKNMA